MEHLADRGRGALRELLNWRSLRWRIAALVAVATATAALAVGLLVHDSTFDRSMSEGRSDAGTALDQQFSRLAQTGRADLLVPPAEMPEPLARRVLAHGHGTLYEEGRPAPRMWAAEIRGGRAYATYVDMTTDLLNRQALDRHMEYASLAALMVVVPLSALAAELPNWRLRRVARTARRIAAGDLDARTGESGRRRPRAPRGDEISDISASVDSMADSLQRRLQAEQRFTADVAHELRTPLMGLVASAELLPDSEATDLVRSRVRVLRGLVEDLLEISRLDAGVEHADLRPVPLGEAVAESLARTGLAAEVAAADAATALTDPRRLDRIVTNLVANAHRHGGGSVRVTVSGTTIVVRDHGPGFPEAVLREGPRRFRTGAAERGRGHGLGLTVAAGQARVLGAALEFANAADGGAVATLRLPDAGGAEAAAVAAGPPGS